MARLPRVCLPGIPLHLIQRGNNRQVCFASQDDFAAYACWLQEYASKYRVEVHAWVFMTNHVHLLVTPSTASGVSRMMQSLGQRYVRYFNYTYRRTGTLWEGRYKSCAEYRGSEYRGSGLSMPHFMLDCPNGKTTKTRDGRRFVSYNLTRG